MKTQEIRVPRKEKELKIVLIPETMDIDEVVVTGYGNFSKSSFTGSANTLRTDMLKEVPVMSVEQKLQGMTTGTNNQQFRSTGRQPKYSHQRNGIVQRFTGTFVCHRWSAGYFREYEFRWS